jgi:hypothetical protein
MGEIDDPHDAEDQRQAAADKKQQRAVRYAVEGLNHPELCVHCFLIRLPSTDLTMRATGPTKARPNPIKLIGVQNSPTEGTVRILRGAPLCLQDC